MKSIFTITLLLASLVSFSQDRELDTWYIENFKDDFGDPTGGTFAVIIFSEDASFSNSATTGDDLCGILAIERGSNGSYYIQPKVMTYCNGGAKTFKKGYKQL